MFKGAETGYSANAAPMGVSAVMRVKTLTPSQEAPHAQTRSAQDVKAAPERTPFARRDHEIPDLPAPPFSHSFSPGALKTHGLDFRVRSRHFLERKSTKILPQEGISGGEEYRERRREEGSQEGACEESR